MIVEYRQDNLIKLLKDFYVLTGMRVTVFDAVFNEIARYPENSCEFCTFMKAGAETRKMCERSDSRAFNICQKNKGPYSYVCHAGLSETAVPIVCADTAVGYMMFGQVFCEDAKEKRRYKPVACEEPAAAEMLSQAYMRIKRVSREKIAAASGILQACAGYIWYSDSFVGDCDSIKIRLERYVEQHISEKLTSAELSKALGVSRAQLYKAVGNKGTGVAGYVRNKRIEIAKQLLLSSDYKVSAIAQMAGIGDYNYFTKLFRMHTGLTPRQYRAAVKIKENVRQ